MTEPEQGGTVEPGGDAAEQDQPAEQDAQTETETEETRENVRPPRDATPREPVERGSEVPSTPR